MAGFTLTNTQVFPNGTSVSAYPVSNWPAQVFPSQTEAAPIGSATNTQTMTGGTLTFTGLTAGVDYVAYAQVGGVHRYIRFTAGADVSSGQGIVRVGSNPSNGQVPTFDSASGLWTPQTPATAPSMASVYRGIYAAGGQLGFDVGAATYVLDTNNPGTPFSALANGANWFLSGQMWRVFIFKAADYAVTGLTTKLRVRAAIATNATAPAINFTVGLYPVTSFAGGIDQLVGTLGTVVPGSTVALSVPSASSLTEGNSGDLTIPSDGAFMFGVVTSGTIANNAATNVSANLQVRNV